MLKNYCTVRIDSIRKNLMNLCLAYFSHFIICLHMLRIKRFSVLTINVV